MGFHLDLRPEEERKRWFTWNAPNGETLELEVRPVPSALLRQWIRKNTRRGVTDWLEVLREKFKYAVTNWRNVVDQDGNPVEYQFALLDQIMTPDLQADLSDFIDELAFMSEPRKKKSKTS